MGLDSVELVLAVEETFAISIPDRDAATLITPALLISHVQRAVSSRPVQRPCLSQRAFHRVRSGLCKVTEFSRSDIRLETRIDYLFPKGDRQQRWDKFGKVTGLRSLPRLTLGRGTLFAPKLVRDIVSFEIGAMSDANRETGDWTDGEVRSVVREIISEQLGIERFNDNDEFVRDLGLD